MNVIERCIYITGSPRVEGDKEESEIDDLEHEFDYGNIEASGFTQSVGAIPSGRGGHAGSTGSATSSKHDSSSQGLEVPLLTYGEEVIQGLSLPLSLPLTRLFTLCDVCIFLPHSP